MQFFSGVRNGLFPQGWTLLYGNVDRAYPHFNSQQCGFVFNLLSSLKSSTFHSVACTLHRIRHSYSLREKKIHNFCNM